MFLLVLLVSLLAAAVYFLWIKPYNYWKSRSIPYVKPLPFVGNVGENFMKKKCFAELLQDFYYAHPEERFVGFYQFLTPTLLVRDPELIKQITVKEFDTFPEHRSFVPEDVDPLWAKNLFAIKGGKRWHDLRSTLSPSFTGSKMKMMFGLMKDCAGQFVEHFQKTGGLIEVEMKDSFSRFTNDVIATTAFGVTCDSLKNPENEFYSMGRKATDFTGINGLRFFVNTISPGLMKLLNIGIISGTASKFFRELVSENIAVREKNKVVRPDMLHLLLEARKGHLKQDAEPHGFAVVQESAAQQKSPKAELTEEDITAQAFVFFLGGFDTSSTFMCFTAHELAVNPDVQERLYREVKDATEDNEVTYDALSGMKYLDMVVSESLRKWPPGIILDRINTRPYTFQPKRPGGKPVTIEPGTNIWMPIFAIHRDPNYYPDPEKFDPERFSEQNKDKIVPYTYIPFGCGPRNCIGARFAVLETKLIIVEILRKFEIVPVEKTQIPLKLLKGAFPPFAEKGFWLGLKPRT